MSLAYPQHVKKKCSSEDFQALESGKKTFEVKLSDISLEVGDLITFVEVINQDGSVTETGRTLTRRVCHLEDLSDLIANHRQELDEKGLTGVGLESPESKLSSILGDTFAMAFVVEKLEDRWEVNDSPHYWPILLAPSMMDSGITDDLKIDNWPVGVYSCHLLVRPEIKSMDEPILLDIVDQLILSLVEGEGEAKGTVVGLEVEPAALMLGQCVGIHGHKIEPAHPEVVSNYLQEESEGPELTIDNFPDIENMTNEELEELVTDTIGSEEEEDLNRIVQDVLEARKSNE